MSADQSRPAILLVTRNLPPLLGGMERLMQNAFLGMTDYANVTVIGPKGCREHLPGAIEVRECAPGLLPFLIFSTWAALRCCARNRFNIVIGGSGIVAPTLFILKLIFSVKTAVFLHGLDLVVDSWLYRKLFVPCIRRVDLVIANSRNTLNIATKMGVETGRLTIINPGTTLPSPVQPETIREFRQRYAIPFDQIILFVGRMTQRKGLSSFISDCLPAILAARAHAGLVIVGENPVNSLNKLGEEDKVLRAIAQFDAADKIRFLGRLDDDSLLTCYATADVQVLPLVDVPGDVEGFGMIAVEAAAAGTPTVAFELGGVADAISTDNGALVLPGMNDLFAQAVINELPKPEIRREQCRNHAARFSWPLYNAQVRAALRFETEDED